MAVAALPPPSDQTRTSSFRVHIPTAVAEHYEAIAELSGKDVGDIIAERLVTCASYYDDDPGRPLHFNQTERQELEKLLARNVFNTRDALVLIRNAMTLRLANQKVTLSPQLLQKLKSRCLGMEWDAFLVQTVTQELERFVQMR